jgi:ADP-heptose:LPS heptosyltransferase
MSPVLDRLAGGARVAVIRLRSLGDCVLTTPALRILRQARPDLEVAVVVEDRFREVFEGNPDISRLLPPSLPLLARWRASLCLNYHGGTRSMGLTVASAARWRAGFGHFRGTPVYNIRIPRAQDILGVERKVHTAEHLASAMFYLGAPRIEIPPARLFASPPERTAPYAVFHPMASHPSKTWPARFFAAVAEHAELHWNLKPVFIGGPGDDLSPFRCWCIVAGAPLSEVKSLLVGASLFLGNDSGPAHMAAALGVPLAVIFAGSDPQVWSPWRANSETIVAPGPVESLPPGSVIRALERLRVAA